MKNSLALFLNVFLFMLKKAARAAKTSACSLEQLLLFAPSRAAPCFRVFIYFFWNFPQDLGARSVIAKGGIHRKIPEHLKNAVY